MGKLLDELYAMIAAILIFWAEIAITVALYLAMLLAGWWLLGWLARLLFGS